jgi:FtsP/CotA-like multicopper oxidase with cupredoxin domain/Cu/Ag efflux protein CusF
MRPLSHSGMSGLLAATALAVALLSSSVVPTAFGAQTTVGQEDSAASLPACDADRRTMCREVIPGAAADAVVLGRDLDGDGDADEITIRLEVDEIQQEVYPGKFVTFWVFAPPGDGMVSLARAPSPTIRVEQGDHVKIMLENTHYFPHTIHLHGTIHPNAMDGVPDITQTAVMPGKSFTYEFVAQHPGTFFYHCHVQPDVHILMGLAGMLIVEAKRPHNYFHHLIIGAGRIPDLAAAEREEGYTREYSLVYQDVDDRLHRIPTLYKDPMQIERAMHRDYDITQRRPDVFLLNGRSFPFTLRDTPIEVASGDRVLLRVLNAGESTINLHTHGHHFIITALDGYAVPEGARVVRDVVTIGPAQRADLELRPGSDSTYASGPGVWLMHDHTERAATNHGISPGGDATVIVYDGFKDHDGLPKVATSLKRFFDPAYYQGKVPVFDPSIYHEQMAAMRGEPGDPPFPVRDATGDEQRQPDPMESHKVVATSCKEPRSTLKVRIREGTGAAGAGQVYGFEPRVIHAEPCQTVEVVLENSDEIRHDLMIPGLDPMFMLDFRGPGTTVGRFVTPDHDVTLEFHCHVPTHEEMGMRGLIIVGRGSPGTEAMVAALENGASGTDAADAPVAEQRQSVVGNGGAAPTARLFQGSGILKAVDRRAGRIIIAHKEIPGLMAAMTMSYLVAPTNLLSGFKPGDHVSFIIDADKREIVGLQHAPD